MQRLSLIQFFSFGRAGLLTVIFSVVFVFAPGEMIPAAYAGGPGWPNFRLGAAHDGDSPDSSINASNVRGLKQQWAFGNGAQQSDPIVGGLAVFITTDGKLEALDEHTGHVNWSRTWSGLDDPAYLFPDCGRGPNPSCEGTVFDVEQQARYSCLHAINERGGGDQWVYCQSSSTFSWPTVAFTETAKTGALTPLIYVTSPEGTIYAFGRGSRLAWKRGGIGQKCLPRGCPQINSITPAEYDGVLYMTEAGGGHGTVYAFGAARGRYLWSSSIGNTGNGPASLAVSHGHILIATSNAEVISIDARTGKPQWTYTQGKHGVGTGLTAAGGLVYVTGLGNGPHGANPQLEALNINTGKVVWTFMTAGYSAMTPTVAGSILYASDTSGDLYAINAKTGKLIVNLGHLDAYGPTYPAIVGDWVYVANVAFQLSS